MLRETGNSDDGGAHHPSENQGANSPTVVTLGLLVKDALDQFDNDKKKAISYLTMRLRNDKKLLSQIIQKAIEDALGYRASLRIKNIREDVKRAQMDSGSLSRAITMCALDFPMSGGKSLREATRKEAACLFDHYQTSAETMLQRSRFLALIIKECGSDDDVVIGTVISDERANQIWKESEKDNG